MKDDRFHNGELTTPLPSGERGTSGREESPTVDERGIPILDEVVYPETDLSDDSALITPEISERHGLRLPNSEALLVAIRAQLRERLENELEGIIDRVATAATEQLEQALRQELRETLSSHLRELLDGFGSGGPLDQR